MLRDYDRTVNPLVEGLRGTLTSRRTVHLENQWSTFGPELNDTLIVHVSPIDRLRLGREAW
jgi:hypothetical protein